MGLYGFSISSWAVLPMRSDFHHGFARIEAFLDVSEIGAKFF